MEEMPVNNILDRFFNQDKKRLELVKKRAFEVDAYAEKMAALSD